jgi:ATP-dependent Clp protease ATP-binding subunit ClpA
MWQRFTHDARKVVFYAQEEAGRLGQAYVSAEHFLLGLTREPGSAAAIVLDRLGVSSDRLRTDVLARAEKSTDLTHHDMQLSVGAKRVIDLAYDEARRLENEFIGTEHLLIGMIRDDGGLPASVLSALGVDLDVVRNAVDVLQAERRAGAGDAPSGRDPVEIGSQHDTGMRDRRRLRPGVNSGGLRRAPTHDVPFRVEVEAATRLAALLGQSHVTPVHLAVVLFSDPPPAVTKLLGDFGVDPQALLAQFPEADATTPAQHPTRPLLSYEAGYVLTRAVEKAWGLFHDAVAGREHLLMALIEEPQTVGVVLRAAGLEPYCVLQDIIRLREKGD